MCRKAKAHIELGLEALRSLVLMEGLEVADEHREQARSCELSCSAHDWKAKEASLTLLTAQASRRQVSSRIPKSCCGKTSLLSTRPASSEPRCLRPIYSRSKPERLSRGHALLKEQRFARASIGVDSRDSCFGDLPCLESAAGAGLLTSWSGPDQQPFHLLSSYVTSCHFLIAALLSSTSIRESFLSFSL